MPRTPKDARLPHGQNVGIFCFKNAKAKNAFPNVLVGDANEHREEIERGRDMGFGEHWRVEDDYAGARGHEGGEEVGSVIRGEEGVHHTLRLETYVGGFD